MTTRTTFQFKFSRLFSKNRHPGKFHCTFFTTTARKLISVEGGEALSRWSLINGIIFALKLVGKWHSHCPVKMTSVRARTVGKSRPRLRILSFLMVKTTYANNPWLWNNHRKNIKQTSKCKTSTFYPIEIKRQQVLTTDSWCSSGHYGTSCKCACTRNWVQLQINRNCFAAFVFVTLMKYLYNTYSK